MGRSNILLCPRDSISREALRPLMQRRWVGEQGAPQKPRHLQESQHPRRADNITVFCLGASVLAFPSRWMAQRCRWNLQTRISFACHRKIGPDKEYLSSFSIRVVGVLLRCEGLIGSTMVPPRDSERLLHNLRLDEHC